VSFGAWNPGVASPVPPELRALCTDLRPENVFTSAAAARELHDLTRLDISELVAFRPRRLALHELLVRVTANVSVPDGERIGDLGVNFRRLTGAIFTRHVEPRMGEIEARYASVKARALQVAKAAMNAAFAADHPEKLMAEWQKKSAAPAADRATYRALGRVASAIIVGHGRLWGPREVLVALAVDMACNDAGSDAIGALIEPWVLDGAVKEGFKLLPRRDAPVVMNTKGPSASGKSTLRPLQRSLAAEIGVDWSDFSLVSPDIWRKQLLDYDSLGENHRYAGPFTGEELRIVDLKLDRYMAEKAARGQMSHLLIDRFRFDSFAPDSDEAGSNLLTRFGRTVYLFFMITPPGSLVERAWARGLEFGRYKAVEDTLAHGVEAYSGMGQIFSTWVRRTDKRVHFEFLDNSVALGERPRTVAFGWNAILRILDLKALIDVERFRKVNIGARAPHELWPDPAELVPERNLAFLKHCMGEFREVEFVDPASGRAYLHVSAGEPEWIDRGLFEEVTRDFDTRAGLRAMVPRAFGPVLPSRTAVPLDAEERRHTLGQWG
jgi:hypothetical protein